MKSLFDYIVEKRAIVFDDPAGKNYNQCIILAGGAASGKGFIQNRIDANFKVFDVDELKKLYIKLAKKGIIADPREYNLNNAHDVEDLHMIVKNRKWKKEEREMFWDQRIVSTPKENLRKPNILFDMVSDNPDDIREVLMYAKPLGYTTTLVWVACNMDTARVSNIIRGIGAPDKARSVPEDILLSGHIGAKQTIFDILSNKYEDINDKLDHAWIALGTGFGRKMDSKYEKNCAIDVPKKDDKWQFNKSEVEEFLKTQQPIDYQSLKKVLNSDKQYGSEKINRFFELVPDADRKMMDESVEGERDILTENAVMRLLADYEMI